MKIINATAAIIERDGKFLIAKRKRGKHLENKWEFPGGKIEDKETPEECLARELEEEFGIVAKIADFVAESVFNYGDKKVRLLGYRAQHISGEFILNDHDEVRWIFPNEFDSFDFAEADIPIIKKVLTLI